MKDSEWIKGIATSSFKSMRYNRCSKCGKIFEPSDNVYTNTVETDYSICDSCFEEVE